VKPLAAVTSIPLVPEQRRRHRIFGGLTDRQEHILTWIGVVVVLFYLAGWAGAIREAINEQRQAAREEQEAKVKAPLPPPRAPTKQITSTLTTPGAPTAAFISDAMLTFLSPLRGASGKVEFATRPPNTPIVSGAPQNAKSVLVGGSGAQVASDFIAPAQPGVYQLAADSVQLGSARVISSRARGWS